MANRRDDPDAVTRAGRRVLTVYEAALRSLLGRYYDRAARPTVAVVVALVALSAVSGNVAALGAAGLLAVMVGWSLVRSERRWRA